MQQQPLSYEQLIQSKVLRQGQYKLENNKVIIEAPKIFKKTKEQEIDESTKKIEELKEEIKKLEIEKKQKVESAENEYNEILDKAELEAERIIKEAEKNAFERIQNSIIEKEKVIEEQKKEAQTIIENAKAEANKIISEAQKEAIIIKENARKEGFEIGRDEGFAESKKEIEIMIDRLKTIIYATIKERENILVHSEKQIINLIITMVKKIVKKLTEEEENVVINNTKEALSIIRGAMKVYIHVNPDDYEFTTKHKEELIRMIEGMPEVKFFENPAVDKGGVIIETDIGEVDARISTQLEEIIDKVKFYMPVKVKSKGIDNILNDNEIINNIDNK